MDCILTHRREGVDWFVVLKDLDRGFYRLGSNDWRLAGEVFAEIECWLIFDGRSAGKERLKPG